MHTVPWQLQSVPGPHLLRDDRCVCSARTAAMGRAMTAASPSRGSGSSRKPPRVPHTAWYPRLHGIPDCTVSQTARYPRPEAPVCRRAGRAPARSGASKDPRYRVGEDEGVPVQQPDQAEEDHQGAGRAGLSWHGLNVPELNLRHSVRLKANCSQPVVSVSSYGRANGPPQWKR